MLAKGLVADLINKLFSQYESMGVYGDIPGNRLEVDSIISSLSAYLLQMIGVESCSPPNLFRRQLVVSLYEEYICWRRWFAAIGRISKVSGTLNRRLRNDFRFCAVR